MIGLASGSIERGTVGFNFEGTGVIGTRVGMLSQGCVNPRARCVIADVQRVIGDGAAVVFRGPAEVGFLRALLRHDLVKLAAAEIDLTVFGIELDRTGIIGQRQLRVSGRQSSVPPRQVQLRIRQIQRYGLAIIGKRLLQPLGRLLLLILLLRDLLAQAHIGLGALRIAGSPRGIQTNAAAELSDSLLKLTRFQIDLAAPQVCEVVGGVERNRASVVP